MIMTKRFLRSSGLIVGAITLAVAVFSCKHDPIMPIDPDPNPNPDPPVSATCDPDSVYFQNKILPLLVSNCTESGCHNAADAADGVVLTSYQSIMSSVEHIKDTNWGENKLVESLLETDLEDRMPQGKPPLSTEQINLIKQWVSQGAVNNACDENAGMCDTINGAKYATFVKPLIQAKCQGCHSGSNPQGGVKLTTFAEIKTEALSGTLYNSVTKSSGWMPKGGAKLDNCAISKLRIWIDGGALEN